MNENKTDCDKMIKLLNNYKRKYSEKGEKWRESQFYWMLYLSSGTKGSIIENIIEDWCKYKGLGVIKSDSSESDRIIEGNKVEIKMSTLWETERYRFQQIRDQDYEILLCVGISPNCIDFWVFPKNEIIHKWKETKEIGSQHKGKSGKDTCWFEIDPKNPPEWTINRRCDLGNLHIVLKDITKTDKKDINNNYKNHYLYQNEIFICK